MGLYVALDVIVAGPPMVVATITGVPVGATVTVDRCWDGGNEWHTVRGAIDVPAPGGSIVVRDWACPLNVSTWYRATLTGGDWLDSDTAVAQITVKSGTAWLQDALHPRTGIPIELRPRLAKGAPMLGAGSFATASWDQPVDEVTVAGASFPVVSVGTRSRVAATPVELAALPGDMDDLRDLLHQAGVLLLRGAPTPVLEPIAHVTLAQVREQWVGVDKVAIVSAVARAVREPSARITIPFDTYDSIQEHVAGLLGAGRTYDEVLAATPPDLLYNMIAANPRVIGTVPGA